jgi:FecR protein
VSKLSKGDAMRTNGFAEDANGGVEGGAGVVERFDARRAAAPRTALSSKLRTLALASLVMLTAGCSGAVTLESVLRPDGADATVEDIRVFRNGTPVTPELSMGLVPGDEIRTEADSTAIIRFADGTEVIVGPNTHIRIGSLWVLFGEIYVKARGLFRVETLYVTAGVEGTQYLLTVDSQAEMSMVVLDGAVRLTSKTGSWEPVALRKLEHGVFRPQETPLMSRVDPAQGNRIIQAINQPVPKILAPASPAATPSPRTPGIELGPKPAVQPPAAGPGLAPKGNLPAPGSGLPAKGIEVPASKIPQGSMTPGGVEVPGSRVPLGPMAPGAVQSPPYLRTVPQPHVVPKEMTPSPGSKFPSGLSPSGPTTVTPPATTVTPQAVPKLQTVPSAGFRQQLLQQPPPSPR